MQKSITAHFLKRAFVRMNQTFCSHKWVYDKSLFLLGRRCAEYNCKKCGKIGHVVYKYDYELKRG